MGNPGSKRGVGEGSRAVKSKVSGKPWGGGGGQGWDPRAALGKKDSSGRGAGWAQGQALTRPLSHPPQSPQTPDMEAARPVWPGCREQQPKPRGSGLHFLLCPGGGTSRSDSTPG